MRGLRRPTLARSPTTPPTDWAPAPRPCSFGWRVKSHDAMQQRAALFGCSVAVATACGGLRQAAHFSGSEAPRVVESWQVRDEAVTPPGYDLIGDVTAGCMLREGRRT